MRIDVLVSMFCYNVTSNENIIIHRSIENVIIAINNMISRIYF